MRSDWLIGPRFSLGLASVHPYVILFVCLACDIIFDISFDLFRVRDLTECIDQFLVI